MRDGRARPWAASVYAVLVHRLATNTAMRDSFVQFERWFACRRQMSGVEHLMRSVSIDVGEAETTKLSLLLLGTYVPIE